MKAISLHQPWASWIALGYKTLETRAHDRFCSLKGKVIIIHAAEAFDENALKIASRFLDNHTLIRLAEYDYPKGCLVCTAYVKEHRLCLSNYEENKAALFLTKGRYGLFLKNIMIFANPILWKGHQGIMNIPDEIIFYKKGKRICNIV